MSKTIYLTAVSLLILSATFNTVYAYSFSNSLKLGSSGKNVAQLQDWLVENNFLVIPKGIAKGYFGYLTMGAVSKYQKTVNLPNTGFFGPLTRNLLNSKIAQKSQSERLSPILSSIIHHSQSERLSPILSSIIHQNTDLVNHHRTDATDENSDPIISNLSATLGSAINKYATTTAYHVSYSFTLTAGSKDIFISSNPALALATSSSGLLASSSLPLSGVSTFPISVSGDSSEKTLLGYFAIPASKSRTFTYSGIIDNLESAGGTKTFSITSINYGLSTLALTNTATTTGLSSLSLSVYMPENSISIIPSQYSASNPLKVMFFGDSITWGSDAGSSGQGGYRRYLQNDYINYGDLSGKYQPVGWMPHTNFSGNGPSAPLDDHSFSAPGAGWRVAGGSYSFEDFITGSSGASTTSEFPTDMIYLLAGVNDIGYGASEADTETYFSSGLDEIMAIYPDAVYVIGTYPKFPAGQTISDATMQTYNNFIKAQIISRRAAGKRIFLADHYSAMVAANLTDGSPSSFFNTDNVHPTQRGYTLLADTWFRSGAIRVTDATPTITSSAPTAATLGVSYSFTPTASGTGPFTWDISSGSLPSGLTLNYLTGAITGTPTGIGTTNFTLRVTGYSQTTTQSTSITVTAPLLTDNLIEVWEMNETTAIDRVGSYASKVLSGSVAAASSPSGYAAGPFGTQVGSTDTAFDLSGDFSVQTWVKFDSLNFNPYYLVTKPRNWYLWGDNYGIPLRYDFSVWTGSSYQTVHSANVSPDTGWHRIVAWHVASSKQINIQIDNGVVSSVTYTGTVSTYPSQNLSLGHYFEPDYGFYAGYTIDAHMDQLSIWSRALGTSERSTLYNSGTPLPYTSY